jgi:hypothetical protein
MAPSEKNVLISYSYKQEQRDDPLRCRASRGGGDDRRLHPAQSASVQAQQRGGTSQTDKLQPVNTGDNPYRVIRDWARLDLENRPWVGSNGVAIDRDGKSVWATDRCSPGTIPGCLGSKGNPVHHFDESGKEIRSFGAGMFVWRMGSTSIVMAMCGSPTHARQAPTISGSSPEKTRKVASSSNSVQTARS